MTDMLSHFFSADHIRLILRIYHYTSSADKSRRWSDDCDWRKRLLFSPSDTCCQTRLLLLWGTSMHHAVISLDEEKFFWTRASLQPLFCIQQRLELKSVLCSFWHICFPSKRFFNYQSEMLLTSDFYHWQCTIKEMPDNSACRIGWAQQYANLQAPCGYDRFGYSWRSRKGTIFHNSRGKHFSSG